MSSMHWRQWILFSWMAILIVLIPFPSGKSSPAERVFYLDASRFQYDPAVLRVNPGDKVTIVLSTKDVMHGLTIDGYNVETMTQPTRTGTVTFIADHKGVFRFHCTVVCGNMHPFMTGKLVVGQNSFFLRAAALLGLVMMAGVWMMKK